MPVQLTLILGVALVGHPVLADPVPVVSKPFSTLAIYPQRRAPATVVSDNHSRISAEISARILDIPVRVGERVKQGTLLLRLEQEDFKLTLTREKAALTALKAKLELAEYELKRARSLSKKQAVSEQLLKQRETDRDALLAEEQGQQAARAQAQRQIDKTQIRAPFNAVIVERLAQTGELASPGTALLRIIDTDNLELAAKLSPQQTRDLEHSFAAENTSTVSNAIEFVSAGQRYALTLRTITPVLDTRARTREARLRFTDKNPLPGATGQLVWSPQQASLPADLISQRDGKLGVFVQADNKAHFIELPRAKTGQPVISKLEPGTLIITKGRYRLRDGDTISRTNTDVAVP
ncbi:MAG: efflux RND transporter periplasmic adaptor subunit [Gammaproteobacteria bacterium]|nr:efflux RND transporter periplasmic adaptor subunit [Gammaproteobacteria bacterium]